ncbi:type I restriction enzyme HsdR N-terminal domain-containing protein [Candidatus Cardinium hertigii]|uniref:Type I restriction enzyme HsdR N-terminal domain-containing protein n=1 Tax=Candidatus Cardinium hertigii TaxID=247481 RepID=A0A3N2QBX0_9BACT|nr:type I restriction enzyme HsdR N-terminal domain-containing protein [Candidatus Cardinium hertigii]ROT47300.1 type I restriction enzyme HsdR N-terminal domain-containing protein [Candidatus Cardinium hertigii]
MIPLMLPAFDYKSKQKLNKTYILDLIRKKYLLLTPEEWVRQHMINYLIHHLAYPKGLIRSEKKINGTMGNYRPDIVLCDRLGIAKMIVECKAYHLTLTEATLGQIMQYHRQLSVDILLVTNGIMHFCWQLDHTTHQFKVMEHIPAHQEFCKELDYFG